MVRKYARKAERFLAPEVLERTAQMTMSLVRERGFLAVVGGGYAMQIYGSPRLTGDVDIVSQEAPEDIYPLRPVGTLSFGGRRYMSPEGVEVDLIVRKDHFRGLYVEALDHAAETEDGLPIVSPEYLAVMKFAAGRPKDEDDLVWLLQQPGLVDREKALDIAEHTMGGPFAREAFQSFLDESDWRSERERRSP